VNLASRIYAVSHLSGTFRLRSGLVAAEYFDKYRFESDPALLRDIAAELAMRVPPGVDGLAGLELGGVPLATALSAQTGLPAFFVRKEAKAYGTERVCEGGDVSGLRILVVEDVVTTGGQIVLSTQDLRNAGAAVLVISEDLDELYAICDRLAVLARGRLSDALPTAQLAIEKVGMWMTGEFDARGIYVHG